MIWNLYYEPMIFLTFEWPLVTLSTFIPDQILFEGSILALSAKIKGQKLIDSKDTWN